MIQYYCLCGRQQFLPVKETIFQNVANLIRSMANEFYLNIQMYYCFPISSWVNYIILFFIILSISRTLKILFSSFVRIVSFSLLYALLLVGCWTPISHLVVGRQFMWTRVQGFRINGSVCKRRLTKHFKDMSVIFSTDYIIIKNDIILIISSNFNTVLTTDQDIIDIMNIVNFVFA